MPRRPRLQFPGAIYHVVTRGDGRRSLFHDESHYARATKGLVEEVQRSAWEVYANWYAKRNQRTGHLFQGRYKSFLVEDETYFWALSRYWDIHLNPCRGSRPLCEKPGDWPHSSYSGYARKSRQVEFVQYDTLLAAWAGECGERPPPTDGLLPKD